MDYQNKFKKYQKKYNNLKAGMFALEDRATYEKRTESQYLESWCFNNDIKIIRAEVKELDSYDVSFKRYLREVLIPSLIEVTIEYDYGDSKITRTTNYQYQKYISKGSYGSVFQYSKLGDTPGISNLACKVILSYEGDEDIYIEPELNSVSMIQGSPCKKIDSHILNLDAFFPKISERHLIYNIGKLEGGVNNKSMGITIMPMADGDVYHDLIKIGVLNFEQKKQLFNYTVNVLSCMLDNHNLVYPDLKNEQLLFFRCPDESGNIKYIYTIGDLGGFQKFGEHPIMSYGPDPKIIKRRDIKSINAAAYALAAFWFDIFSSSYHRKILRLGWEHNKFYKDSKYKINHDVEQGLPHISGLELQREVIKEILTTDLKEISLKEQILEYFDRLFIR